MKKTKWKKLSKFLSEKQKEGFLTIKEAKKGIETITAINQEHPDIVNFRVIKYEKPQIEAKNDDDTFEPPIITELYIVPGGDLALFFKALKVKYEPNLAIYTPTLDWFFELMWLFLVQNFAVLEWSFGYFFFLVLLF